MIDVIKENNLINIINLFSVDFNTYVVLYIYYGSPIIEQDKLLLCEHHF